MTSAAISTLVDDINAVLAKTADPDQITQQVARLARPLAANLDWLEPRCYEAEDDQGIGVAILHDQDDHGLIVETVCWLPGRGVAPHDHQTWGVVIGLEGEEKNVNWRRLDDGDEAGIARLAVAEEIAVTNGAVVRLLPDDIHSVRNDGDELSMSLHIYGRDLAHVSRSEFDPINSIQRPCPQRKRNR